MGYSIAFLSDLTFPPGGVARWNELDLDATGLEDAPADFHAGGSVAQELADWEDDFVRVSLDGDRVKLRALVGNSDGLHLDGRHRLVVAFRLAARVGGSGTLDVLGWDDGGDDYPGRRATARSDGTSAWLPLTDVEEAAVRASAAYADLDAMIAEHEAKPQAAPVLGLNEVAARAQDEVVRALRVAEPGAMRRALAAFRVDTEHWLSLDTPLDLAELLPTPGDVADAVAHGTPKLADYQQRRLMIMGVGILARVDLGEATRLARLFVGTDVPPDLRDQALGVLAEDATDAGLEAAFPILRGSGSYSSAILVARDPRVRGVIANAHPDTAKHARERLRSLATPPFGPLEYADGLEVEALLAVLEARGDASDHAFAVELRLDHPSNALRSASTVAHRGGEVGMRALAARAFVREGVQVEAVEALLALDAARALKLFSDHLDDEDAEAPVLNQAFWGCALALKKRPALRSPEWERILARIAEKVPLRDYLAHVAFAVAQTMIAWGMPEAKAVLKRHGAKMETRYLVELLDALGDEGDAPLLAARQSEASAPALKQRVREVLAKLQGQTPAAPSFEHVIEPASSGRASCRGCKQKIAKGELRFGEAVKNVFDDSGEPAKRWYHLQCAAVKKPRLLGPALAAYTGEMPERGSLEAIVFALTAPNKKAKK